MTVLFCFGSELLSNIPYYVVLIPTFVNVLFKDLQTNTDL